MSGLVVDGELGVGMALGEGQDDVDVVVEVALGVGVGARCAAGGDVVEDVVDLLHLGRRWGGVPPRRTGRGRVGAAAGRAESGQRRGEHRAGGEHSAGGRGEHRGPPPAGPSGRGVRVGWGAHVVGAQVAPPSLLRYTRARRPSSAPAYTVAPVASKPTALAPEGSWMDCQVAPPSLLRAAPLMPTAMIRLVSVGFHAAAIAPPGPPSTCQVRPPSVEASSPAFGEPR